MFVQKAVSADMAERLAHIFSLDLSEEKARLGVSPEMADTLEREFKRYLALHTLKPGSYAIPGVVDALWHIFLEDENRVVALEAKTGVRVEHRPDNPKDAWEKLMEATKATYKFFFGPAPDIYNDMGMLCWGCGYCITAARV